MKRKVLGGLIVLLFSFVAAIGTTFAFWDVLTKTNDPVIVIGEGLETTLTVGDIVPAGKFLVPSGVILGANDITSVVLTYNVKVNQKAVDTSYTDLTVSASNILIGGSATYSGLVNIIITPTSPITVGTTDTLVTVTITLTAPANVTEYNIIKNSNITFTLTFQVA